MSPNIQEEREQLTKLLRYLDHSGGTDTFHVARFLGCSEIKARLILTRLDRLQLVETSKDGVVRARPMWFSRLRQAAERLVFEECLP